MQQTSHILLGLVLSICEIRMDYLRNPEFTTGVSSGCPRTFIFKCNVHVIQVIKNTKYSLTIDYSPHPNGKNIVAIKLRFSFALVKHLLNVWIFLLDVLDGIKFRIKNLFCFLFVLIEASLRIPLHCKKYIQIEDVQNQGFTAFTLVRNMFRVNIFKGNTFHLNMFVIASGSHISPFQTRSMPGSIISEAWFTLVT